MIQSEIIARRKQRWLDFYENSDPRLLFIVNILDEIPTRAWPYPQNQQARIDWAWQKYCRMMEHLDWLDDDAIPHLDPYTGTEIFAEAFGCRVQRNNNDMPFALPLVSSAKEADQLEVPELFSSSLSRLFEIGDQLKEKAGEDALMRLVDTQGPMDITALIWDKNSLFPALLENPCAVQELCKKVNTLEQAFLDEWFSRYGREFIAHYPEYYLPYGITLSEDEIGAVNRSMFEQFFLLELVELSEHYGAIGVHCCAHARHQWENLKRIPNLKLLNFVQPEAVLQEALTYFAPICAQMHVWSGYGDPWTWPDQLPAQARVVMQVDVQTRAQALEVTQRLRDRLNRE